MLPEIEDKRFYLFADPVALPSLEYAELRGFTGPRTDSRVGFDVDGVEMKVAYDTGATVVSYQGCYLNPGV